MKSREVLKRLKADGCYETRTKGSHVQLKHPTKKGTVTVPHPKKSMTPGTLKSIERQSGVSLK